MRQQGLHLSWVKEHTDAYMMAAHQAVAPLSLQHNVQLMYTKPLPRAV
jgi:hypothetical protein